MSNTNIRMLPPMLALIHFLSIWRFLSIRFAIPLTVEYSDSSAHEVANLEQNRCKDAAKKPRAAP